MDPPISKLANELLHHIFAVSAWSTASPWTLAAICQRWRAICLDSPALWTRYSLCAQHSFEDRSIGLAGVPPCTIALNRFQLQLQQSQSSMIEVYWTQFERQARRSCALSMLMALLVQCNRWHTVLDLRFIICSSMEDESSRFGYLKSDPPVFSVLESLHYICEPGSSFSLALGPYFTTASLPALRSLHVKNWSGSMSTSGVLIGPYEDPPFPWSQLQHICLVNCISHNTSLLRLLKACPNLTHLALRSGATRLIRRQPHNEPEPDFHSTVLLSHLVQLEMSCNSECKAIQKTRLLDIVQYLSTPNLHTLVINVCGVHGHPTADSEHLSDMIRRSQCTIRCLELSKSWRDNPSESDGSQTPAPSFLPQVSHDLEELCIRADCSGLTFRIPNAATLLNWMIVKDNSTEDTLFPKLRALRIRNLELDLELLEEVVRSRHELARRVPDSNVVPLERIEFRYTVHPPDYKQHPLVVMKYAPALATILPPYGCKIVFDPREFLPRFRLDRY